MSRYKLIKERPPVKKNKLIAFLKEHLVYILSFLLPSLSLLIMIAMKGIYPFGDRSFLHMDMYHQYLPFLTEFFHKLKEGDSLLYSWATGLGSNFVALYVYYLASPFNWLVTFVSENHLMEFITYMIVLKSGLSGLTFSYYLKEHSQKKCLSIVPFALAYAMSGYWAAFNWNVMWLDVIWAAPLVLLGLEKLVKEKKAALYCLSLAFCILTNYYLSIMLCIYLVCYFLVLLINSKERIRSIFSFGLYSMLSGGIAAVLLLPELEMLRLTKFTNSTFPTKIRFYFNQIDCVARQFMNVTVEKKLDHWPNIYCGVIILLLIPLYLYCRNISWKEKLPKILLVIFLLVSFNTNMLNFIWHGMNYPDSLPCRQSYLYIALLLTMSYEALLHMKEYSRKVLLSVYALTGAFVIFCTQYVTDDAFTTSTYVLTGIFLALYVVLLTIFHYSQKHKTILLWTTIFVMLAELSVNMYLTSIPTTSRTSYIQDLPDYTALMEQCNEENGSDFFRMERKSHTSQNDAMLIGYNSTSCFSSTMNALVNEFYDKYGLRSSHTFYSNLGVTPFTSALMATKYLFSKEQLPPDTLYTLAGQSGNVYLYENTYTLPLGFLVDEFENDTTNLEAENVEFSDILNTDSVYHPLYSQNQLAYNMGSQRQLFYPINVTQEEGQADITVEESGHIYAYTDNTKVTDVECTINGITQTFSKLKYSYIMDLGYQTAGTVISLTSNDNQTLDLSAYRLDEKALETLISKLNEEPLVIESYDSTHISGHINAYQKGNLILSIPYETGWQLLVDGEVVEPELFEEAFMAVPLEAGEHTIELRYRLHSLYIGMAVSMISLVVFFLIQRYQKKRK